MKSRLLAFIAAAALLALTTSAYAHHPFAAEYDSTKPVTLIGTVNKVEWTNPHAYLHIDAKDKSGRMKQWTLEMGSPGALTRAGWTPTTLKKGDQIAAEAWLAKSKDDAANLKSVRLKNGRELSGASSITGGKEAGNKSTSN